MCTAKILFNNDALPISFNSAEMAAEMAAEMVHVACQRMTKII